MSAAFLAVFGEVVGVTWYRSGPVARISVTASDRLPSPAITEWVIIPSTDAADAVLRNVKTGTQVFVSGQFHPDISGAKAIVRIFADTISVGVDRPDGPIFFETADAKLPNGWLPLGAIQ